MEVDMWNKIDKNWKEAIAMSWDAYKCDTIPIGAIVVNQKNEIVSRGKNRIFDETSQHPMAGSYMAHAEMTAMLPLKENEHPQIRTYTLYTTMEPCPMCFGTMMMMHIKHLKFGAWDKFAGSLELKDKSEYLRGKSFEIEQAHDHIQCFQIALQTAYECKRDHRLKEDLFRKWSEDYPRSVEIGKDLFEEEYFVRAIENHLDLGQVFDEVISRH